MQVVSFTASASPWYQRSTMSRSKSCVRAAFASRWRLERSSPASTAASAALAPVVSRDQARQRSELDRQQILAQASGSGEVFTCWKLLG